MPQWYCINIDRQIPDICGRFTIIGAAFKAAHGDGMEQHEGAGAFSKAVKRKRGFILKLFGR
jgi:hypothetical protein